MQGEHAENQSEIRFDDFVDTYKKEVQRVVDFSGQDVDFYIGIKAQMLMKMTEKYCGELDKVSALDIGSGIGLVDHFIAGKYGSVTGVDIEEGIIDKARVYNPTVEYKIYDSRKLPFSDNTFDLAFAFNVIHHVPPAMWQNFLNEMRRVIKPGGIAAIFEHNPANPVTRRVVRNCKFDRDAVLLSHNKLTELFKNSGLKILDDAYIIFFPFSSRVFRSVEKILKGLPLGAQQYVVARK